MICLQISTHARNEFLDLSSLLRAVLAEQGWREGVLLLFNPHTTAGLTINEGADPAVRRDMLLALARLVPQAGDYHHAEGNSDAHLKASLMGSSLTIPVEGGQLRLGTWQAVYFCEFDGPRNRRVDVSFWPSDKP